MKTKMNKKELFNRLQVELDMTASTISEWHEEKEKFEKDYAYYLSHADALELFRALPDKWKLEFADKKDNKMKMVYILLNTGKKWYTEEN